MARGFEKVSFEKEGMLPIRGTGKSAGYDFMILDECEIKPNQTVFCKTGIKAYMQNDEYLALHIRSSLAIKKGIILTNSTGIIDADYYNNENNEGHIMISLRNISENTVKLEKYERVVQGIFQKYLTTDDDFISAKRTGGFGSTNQ